MKDREPSFSGRLASWLGGGGANRPPMLSQDIERAIEELQREHKRLAGELESLLASYDQKSRTLAKRLARAMQGADVTSAELLKLKEEQNALWRLIRRGQAAGRSTRALEQELREWGSRSDAGVGKYHPDHPEQRVEFVASELRGRGVDPEGLIDFVRRSYKGSAKDVNALEEALYRDDEDETIVVASDIPVEDAPTVWDTEGTEEHMLREIASCRREIGRLRAHPDHERHDGELAVFYAQLKELHAHLRLQDRKTGERRHRFAIGM